MAVYQDRVSVTVSFYAPSMEAHARPEDREKCFAAGMDGYLSKPIDLKQLDDVLAVY